MPTCARLRSGWSGWTTGSRPYIVFEDGMLAFEAYGTTSAAMWALLVGELGLRISLLPEWLTGRPALSREGSIAGVGHHAASEFYFLAHP